MFELPEFITRARQMNETLQGKRIRRGNLGNSPHEFDLFKKPGGYNRLMDSRAAGNPCPACGAVIRRIQYLGGACYFCPSCQE